MRDGGRWLHPWARTRAGLPLAAALVAATALVLPLGSASAADSQPAVSFSPAALAFGDDPVGRTADAQAVTLTNTGDAPLAISTFRLGGADAADFGQGAACPISPDVLAVGASCTVYVSFTPHSAGAKAATLVVGDDAASSPQTVALSGTGVSGPQVQLAPGALGFGTLQAGSSSPAQTVTLTNAGDATLLLGSIGLAGANASEFTQTTTCDPAGGVPAGGSCTVAVAFAPTSSGDKAATLSIQDSAGSQSVPLTGIATAAPSSGLPAGVYFADGFESGLGLWDVLSSSGSSVVVDAGVVNSGSASVRLSNGGSGESSRLFADLAGGGHARSYTRFCFRVGSGLSEGIELANGRAVTAEYPLGIRRWEVTYNPVTRGLEGYFWNEGLQRLDLFTAGGLVAPGGWHCAELFLDESVGGSAELWLDGVSVGSVSGDLSTPSPYGRVYLWNQPAAGSVWFDDVEVADNPIGLPG